jgi:ketosteroid isomerase-like protein
LSRGDLDSLMSVYAEDVISLPPNQPARVGKAAVQAMWEETLSDFAVEVSVSVEEVEVAGGWAFERGTFNMRLSPRAGDAPIEDTGKYLDVLRQQADGSWKYSRVSWNSSEPAS